MMDSSTTNILLVEDNPADARLIEIMLSKWDDNSYSLTSADKMSSAIELLSGTKFQLALLDMSLPDGEGLDNILKLKSCVPDLPIIVLSGRYDEGFALEAVKAGAQDYLVKGRVDEEQLTRAVSYAIERRRLQEDVIFMAHHDHLTGLKNRALFRSRLEHALLCAERRNESVALLSLDLDHFKPINDELGHDMGDKLLIEVANRLSEAVREVDTVARMGGDEFAIILEGIEDINNVTIVAEKIIKSLTRPIEIKEHSLKIGASMGITFYPHCGKDIDTLICNADKAMYQAKHNGRNQFHFYDCSSDAKHAPLSPAPAANWQI